MRFRFPFPFRGRFWNAVSLGDDIPEAQAFLSIVHDRRRSYWRWTVPTCPLCRRQHVHGGGELDEDPQSYLNARAAHCQCKTTHGSYELVDGDPARTERLMSSRWG